MLPPSLEQALGQWGGSKMLAGKRKGRMRELRASLETTRPRDTLGNIPFVGLLKHIVLSLVPQRVDGEFVVLRTLTFSDY